MVYTILIADRGFYAGLGYSGYSAMKKMTEETGGRLIDVDNNGKKLEPPSSRSRTSCALSTWPATRPRTPKWTAASARSRSSVAAAAPRCRSAKAISRPRRKTSVLSQKNVI